MYISDKISSCLCKKLLKKKVITDNTYSCYQYSFDFVLDLIIFHVSIIVLGNLLKSPFLSFLYIMTMTPIKMLSGGAHAKTRTSCSLISYMIFASTILTIQHQIIFFNPTTAIVIYLSNAILILILTPVDTKNKRIPTAKRNNYKKNCGMILSFITIFFFFFIVNQLSKPFSLITLCVIIILINQIIGILINVFEHRKD